MRRVGGILTSGLVFVIIFTRVIPPRANQDPRLRSHDSHQIKNILGAGAEPYLLSIFNSRKHDAHWVNPTEIREPLSRFSCSRLFRCNRNQGRVQSSAN